MEIKKCPICGNNTLYEQYATLEGFIVPTIFCDTCKFIFTVEGSEDYITGTNDGFARLREEWNARDSRSCYADEVTHHNCKYSINRGWCEHTLKPIGEWHKISQTQEVRERMCGCCGNELGVDSRNHFPFEIEHLCELPNYCPKCGAKVVD